MPTKTVDSPDFGELKPMVDATQAELEATGVNEKPEVVLARARSRRRSIALWTSAAPASVMSPMRHLRGLGRGAPATGAPLPVRAACGG